MLLLCGHCLDQSIGSAQSWQYPKLLSNTSLTDALVTIHFALPLLIFSLTDDDLFFRRFWHCIHRVLLTKPTFDPAIPQSTHVKLRVAAHFNEQNRCSLWMDSNITPHVSHELLQSFLLPKRWHDIEQYFLFRFDANVIPQLTHD